MSVYEKFAEVLYRYLPIREPDASGLLHILRLKQSVSKGWVSSALAVVTDIIERRARSAGYLAGGSIDPDNSDLAENRVDHCLGTYQVRKATSILSQTPENHAAHGRFLMRLALIENGRGRVHTALRYWSRLVEQYPSNEGFKFHAANANLLCGRLDVAVRGFRALLPTEEPSAVATIRKADARLSQIRRRTIRALRLRGPGDGALPVAQTARLAADLVALGRLPAADRVLALMGPEERRSEDYIEAKFRLLVRGVSIEAAVAYLKGAPPSPHTTTLLADALLEQDRVDEALDLATKDEMDGRDRLRLLCRLMTFVRNPAKYRSLLMYLAAGIDLRTDDFSCLLNYLLLSGALRFWDRGLRAGDKPISPHRIPFRLFQFWHSSQIPEDVTPLIASWSQLSPGLECVIFNDLQAKAFLRQKFPEKYLTAYERCHHPAMQSDLIRLAYLYKCGGIYVDIDEKSITPLAKIYKYWVNAETVLVITSADDATYVYSALLAARPGAALMGAALDEAVDSLLARPQGEKFDIWQTTGPGVITRAFVRSIIREYHGKRKYDRDCPVPNLLLTYGYFRRFSSQINSLSYKQSTKGNWRL